MIMDVAYHRLLNHSMLRIIIFLNIPAASLNSILHISNILRHEKKTSRVFHHIFNSRLHPVFRRDVFELFNYKETQFLDIDNVLLNPPTRSFSSSPFNI